MKLREVIIKIINETAEDQGIALKSPIEDSTILLETGLDSLAFAIIVARLEEELNYDPFLMMKEAYYPTTFEEFVSTYEKFYSI